MDRLEYTRQKLHKTIESGDLNQILEVSQELDELIIHYMEIQKTNNLKTA